MGYAYVQMDPRAPVYTNLGKLASCPVRDVPEAIGPTGQPAKWSRK